MTDIGPMLRGTRIIPVLTVPSVAMAGPLAEALAAGGARCAEVTFRTPAAEEVLRRMAAHGGLSVGAGTVLTPEQAERAVAAGAEFVVSPGFDADVVQRCQQLDVPVVPGVATATELQAALKSGVQTVKLFPAERLGGVATLAALAAPFPGVQFVPTGGIGPDQVSGYLAHPAVLAVGGSWMAPVDHLERGDYSAIRRITAETMSGAAA
jgi:2-dehydro-3-deoxyphosphogluconate aldolase / (4S)-4-hydroxy-2-oxoglutarate aldolase